MASAPISETFRRVVEAVQAEPGLAKELAKRAGVNWSTVYRAVRGSDVGISTADKLLVALDEILTERQSSPAPAPAAT